MIDRNIFKIMNMNKRYIFKLFIYGQSDDCKTAIKNFISICNEKLHSDYDLKVVDIKEEPEEAEEERLIAVPTLIRQSPTPERRIIGNFQDKEKVLAALDLTE